ncbi:iron ABC transporter permease [Labrenzia sp. 011]|uniref:ABC transporter permease n=1 Tax=Labrenzia sp. 011 TaxID=2171494 RepID=UPI000D50F764|nr:iron ABC transporter permease [Labrenzia sp. 011]PVB60586.1 hypothetical protein DCO57_16590 [Labrenzia sp. 011]
MNLGRGLPTLIVSLIVGGLVFAFIALPMGAMLVRSFHVDGPVSMSVLRDRTETALLLLPPNERETFVTRAVSSADPSMRMEAIAAAMTLADLPVQWDRKAAYSKQIVAADEALARLPADKRESVEAHLSLAIVMLHKRIPLAYKVKDKLAVEDYSVLRSGKIRRYGLDHYREVIETPRMATAALNSLKLASIATVLTTLVAYLLAFGVNRGGIWRAGLARYAILLPLVSPPVVIATAIVLLFGRNGLVTRALLDDTLGLIDAGSTNLYGFYGVVVVQFLSFLPPAFIILDNVLSKQDGRLEEAAAIQGAGFRQTFFQLHLPMAQPGLIRAATLVFILAMTDFGNPMVIGQNMNVLAGVLYDEMIGFSNTPLASAIAVWLIVPVLAVYALLARIGRHKRFETSETAASAIALPAALNRGLSCLAWGIASLTAVIFATIIMGAIVRRWGQDYSLTLDYFTSANVPGFVSQFDGIEPVWTSLWIVLAAAPLGGLLAVIVAYLAERVRNRLNAAIGFLVLLPAILPGAVFGVGYIVAFNAPFGVADWSLNGTRTLIILNIAFGHLYVGVLAGRAMLSRLDRSVDDAAEILGASLWQRFSFVTLPMMRRAVLFGALFIFVDGMCTFSAVVFLQGPDFDLASVAIFQTASVSYYGVACAMSVAILAIVFAVMGGLATISRFGPLSLREAAGMKKVQVA